MSHEHDHHAEIHDHDKPVGRVLSRRDVLSIFGKTSVVLLSGLTVERFLNGAPDSRTILAAQTNPTPLPSCIVQPQLTEGPYFVDNMLNRSDIRVMLDENGETEIGLKDGAPLRLLFNVFLIEETACTPLPNAQIDIWHCDVEGEYSGVSDGGFETVGEQWLRGYQITDDSGHAEFTTVYPGWYPGRAVHIHFKVRTDPESNEGYEFTSQFFFDEDFTDTVYEQVPYISRQTGRRFNEDDGIFQQSNDMLTLNVEVDEESDFAEEETGLVYVATFDVGLDTSQEAVTGGDRPRGGGRP